MRSRITLLIAFLLVLGAGASSAQRYNHQFAPRGLPLCTLVAQDAWNFNDKVNSDCAGPVSCSWYDNMGTIGVSGREFVCYAAGSPFCPGEVDGPSDSTAIYVTGSVTGLLAEDRAWNDYSIANQVSFSFHWRNTSAGAGDWGWTNTSWLTVVRKVSEFWVGAQGEPSYVCMDITGLGDSPCGTGGANSGNAPILDLEWHRMVFVFDGIADTKTVYVDGVQVGQETSVTGVIPNTANDFIIGFSLNGFWLPRYELDNLQIFDYALSEAEVAELNCNVPDA